MALPALQAELSMEEVRPLEPFLLRLSYCGLSRGLPLMSISWCILQNHFRVGGGLQQQVG